uniref:Uncharacterized protein n=1 Tax=Rhizophora mucronata TaxID=61149 RepID=A0A2P2M5F0_RHIMU
MFAQISGLLFAPPVVEYSKYESILLNIAIHLYPLCHSDISLS